MVIGKRGFRIAEAGALDHVAGCMIGLDMTIRGTEDRGFRMSLDTFTVFGPYLVTADEIAEPGDLDLGLELNGERRQKSNTRLLVLGIEQLIACASKAYTLRPGDVIMTGTPETGRTGAPLGQDARVDRSPRRKVGRGDRLIGRRGRETAS